jgi:hypothetical protein
MAPQRDPAAACHSGALFATSRADYLSLDRATHHPLGLLVDRWRVGVIWAETSQSGRC